MTVHKFTFKPKKHDFFFLRSGKIKSYLPAIHRMRASGFSKQAIETIVRIEAEHGLVTLNEYHKFLLDLAAVEEQ